MKNNVENFVDWCTMRQVEGFPEKGGQEMSLMDRIKSRKNPQELFYEWCSKHIAAKLKKKVKMGKSPVDPANGIENYFGAFFAGVCCGVAGKKTDELRSLAVDKKMHKGICNGMTDQQAVIAFWWVREFVNHKVLDEYEGQELWDACEAFLKEIESQRKKHGDNLTAIKEELYPVLVAKSEPITEPNPTTTTTVYVPPIGITSTFSSSDKSVVTDVKSEIVQILSDRQNKLKEEFANANTEEEWAKFRNQMDEIFVLKKKLDTL